MNMELRPSQKQTITHQMIQSSEILQMNNMGLMCMKELSQGHGSINRGARI